MCLLISYTYIFRRFLKKTITSLVSFVRTYLRDHEAFCEFSKICRSCFQQRWGKEELDLSSPLSNHWRLRSYLFQLCFWTQVSTLCLLLFILLQFDYAAPKKVKLYLIIDLINAISICQSYL